MRRLELHTGDVDEESTAGTRWASLAPLAAIATIGLAIAMAVGIGGDFPLSDDWSYAHAVRALCVDGRLELLPWTGASLVLQAWYGAILCKLFGFSFVVLRTSTVAIAIAGALGFYLLAREYRVATPSLLALAAVTFGLDPFYVNLAFTFMTDVPFLALLVWATLLYARGLGRADARTLVGGSLLCAAAILVRQHAIFVAAAAALTALVAAPALLRQRAVLALAAGSAPVLALGAYFCWLFFVHGAPAAVAIRLAESRAIDPVALADVAFRSLAYLGLLLAPLVVGVAAVLWQRTRMLLAASTALVACGALVLLVRNGELMFYLSNTLYDFGVGPLTLRDTMFLGMRPPVHVGLPLAVPITIAAIAGAGSLLAACWAIALRRGNVRAAFAVIATATMLAGSVVSQSNLYLDRHVLPALPFAILVMISVAPRERPNLLAWALAAALGWYGLAGTHDYLAWNAARFAMLDELESAGEDSRRVDGGVEYNGWKLAAELGTWPSMDEARIGQPASRKSWWWVVEDQFVVSFRALDGYRLLRKREYRRWLVPGTGRLLLLERSADDPRGSRTKG